jgi:spermidine dehydrogenase
VGALDDNLGLGRRIPRRDFLNGVAIGIGAALSHATLLRCGLSPESLAADGLYPPALTGMRGSHDGSFEASHLLRDGRWSGAAPAGAPEQYDLVVVGGGISGLAAAYFFRQRAGGNARVLVLDNHDDFGGHAKRNEFTVGGRLLIGYGGTQSIETPSPYSREARGLMDALGIDPVKLTEASVDRRVYRGLNSAVFFDRETFGADRLVVGMPGRDGVAGAWSEFLARAPLSDVARRDIARIYEANVDYLPGLSSSEKKAKLSTISYKAYLIDVIKAHADVVPFFQSRPHGLYGVGVDAVPALDCWAIGYPGFRGLTLDPGPGGYMSLTALGSAQNHPEYGFHFPDGNASIARLLVRALIPAAVPGRSAEDSVPARIAYDRLDVKEHATRIRLSSTAVRVAQTGADTVDVTYVRQGRTEVARTRGCVLACWNGMIPFLCPELPDTQKEALRYGVKVPLVYTNVAIRNWESFAKLGVRNISCPGSYHTSVSLDQPVSIGGYRCPSSPSEPMVLHLVRTPCRPGLPAREQHRAGRVDLLATSFEKFERAIRDQLARALSAGGFDPARDIAAITVNRWPHGYAYEYNPLWDPEWPDDQRPCVIGRRPFGRITIANSDAAAYAYTDAAIDQAFRAVSELFT